MATTFIDYTGDGNATKSFSFPSIQQSDIKVQVDGVVKSSGTHYNITSYTTTGGGNVVFTSGNIPSSPATIRIYRDTDVDNAKATYTAGSSVKAADLNANHEQLLFAAQEEQNQTILASDIKDGVITSAKITDGTIVNADINASAAIAGTKVTPAFGSQNVSTTGTAATGALTVTGNIGVSGTVDGRDVAADGTKLDGIETAATADQTAAEIRTLVESASDSNVFTDADHSKLNAIEAGATADQTASEIKTLIASSPLDASHLAANSVDTSELATNSVTTIKIENGAVTGAKLATNAVTNSVIASNAVTTDEIAADSITEDKIADDAVRTEHLADNAITTVLINNGAIDSSKIASNAVTTDKIADSELSTLAGMQSATASKLADSTALTADIADLNQIDGMAKQTTITDDDTKFPTSGAVVDYVAAQLEPFGGFEAIANESSFPNTQPASGVAISIADAGGMTVSSSGTASGATVGGTTVNISGIPSNFFSSTIDAGVRFIVTSTGSGQNYTYHKATLKEDDLINLSGDINDFSERYRVGSSNPTSSLDSGDLFFNTGTGKLLVYNGTNSAWEEAQSVGNFFINTISSSSATGGGSATPNGTAYRFTLSNAGTNAEQHIVSVDGVVQKPNSGSSQPSEGFAVSGSDILFGSAPVSGASIFVITIGSTVNIGTPSNNTVNSAILQNGSVTTAKIVDANVTTDKIANNAVTNAKVASDAAIAGTKISPDFGSQNIVTSGSVTADDITIERPTGNLSANFKATNGLGTLEIGGSTGAFIDLKTPFSDDFDFRINHDGVMTSAAGGSIQLQVNGNENGIRTIANGATELYHDNVKQLETQSVGIKVAGHVHATTTGSQVSSGDPSGAGGDYLMLYHDGSNGFIQNGSGGITIRDVSGGNIEIQATNGESSIFCGHNGAVELYYDNSKKLETTSEGVLIGNGGLHLGDNNKIEIGNNDDLQIYHDGTHSRIKNSTGDLFINSDGVLRLQNSGGAHYAKFFNNGAAELYHNNSKKLETTSSGVTITGSVNMGSGDILGSGNLDLEDNGKIKLGTSDDLLIYHDASNSRIHNSTGSLIVRTASFNVENADGTENIIYAPADGAVNLYFNGSKKLETTNTGVEVTGNVQFPDNGEVKLGADDDLRMFHSGSANYIQSYNDKLFRIQSFGTSAQIRIQTNEGENNVVCSPNAGVELYYDNVKKLETNSYGSRVTGYLTQSAPVSWMSYATSQWYDINAGNVLDPFVFNNTDHNIGSHYHTSGTDAGKFVAPVDGVYQLNWNIFCACTTNQTSAATLEMYVKINNSNVSRLHNKAGYGNNGDDQQVMTLSVTEQLSAGDKVHLRLAAYTANWQVYGGHSTFSGHLVG